MAGPFKYDAFFPFPEYEEAINKITAANKEFGESLKSMVGYMQKNFNAVTSDVKSLSDSFEKVDTNSQNFGKSFSYVNEQLDQAGVKLSTYKKAQKDFSDAIVIADGSVTDLTNKLKIIKGQYEALNPDVEGNKEVMANLAKEYGNTVKQINTLEKELKASAKEVKAAEGSYTFMSNKLTELRKKLKDIPGAFDEMTGAINETNPEVKELVSEIGKYDKALKAADATMGNFTRNVGNYEGATESLKTQLRAIKEEMAQLMLRGEGTSDRFQELKEKAGELDDTMKDVNTTVKNVGSDTRNIEGVAGVFEGVAGALGLAEGAMTLFNIQNKDFEETLKKLAAIQAMVNGLQSISNLLQKESAAMLLITNARQKIALLAKQLETSAESKNIIVKYASIAASKALSTAMAGTPALWLIAIIGVLAGAIIFFTKNAHDAAEAQERLNKVMGDGLDTMQNISDRYQRTIDNQVEANQKLERSLQNQIDIKKANLASDEEIFKLQEELDDKKIVNAQKVADEVTKQSKRTLDNYNIMAKAGLGLGLTSASSLTQARDITGNSIIKQEQLLAKTPIGDDMEAPRKATLDNLKKQYDILNTQIKNQTNAEKDLGAAYKADVIDAINNARKLQENYLKSRINNINTELAKAKEGSEDEYNYKVQLIKKQQDLDLFNARTKSEINLINANAEKAIAKEAQEYKFKLAQSELNAEVSIINSKLSFAESGSKAELNFKKQLVDKQAQLEILSVNNSVLNEREKYTKIKEIQNKALADKKALDAEKIRSDYEANKQRISDARDLEKIRAQITLTDSTASGSDRRKASRILSFESDLKAVDREILNLDQLYAHGGMQFAEYEKAKTELVKEQEQIRLDIAQQNAEKEKAIRQAIVDTMSMGINGLGELAIADSDARISKYQQEKETMLTLAGDDKEKQFKIEQQYNKKVNKEKEKQAKIEKMLAIFNIVLSTSAAVMRSIAEFPETFGLPFSAFALAQGAIQTAIVMAKPTQFRKGTKNAPEGPAIVNDEPGSNFREMVITKQGAYIPEKRNQLVYLQKGDKVMTAAETRGILTNMGNAEMNRIVENAALYGRLSGTISEANRLEAEYAIYKAMISNRIDEQAIGRAVADNVQIHETYMDERGFRRGLRRNNTRTIYLNERTTL